MPTLEESLNTDMTGYIPIERSPSITLSSSAPQGNAEPGLGVFTRCPIPPIYSPSPDSLRTYYVGSQVPQTRLFNPNPPAILQPAANVTNVTNNITNTAQVTPTNPAQGWSSGSNSNSFWEINPIGTVRQWGYISTDIGSGTLPITFPIPFPNSCESVVVTTESVNDRITYVDGTASTTGFTIGNNGTGGFAYWEAIGK
jgi:hypothetical protein